jgi:predicted Fe-S protein YdhL (DUF1289 family)
MAPVAGLCSGCGRTLEEIARWGSMSEEKRWAIMAMLPARMAENGLPKPAARAP